MTPTPEAVNDPIAFAVWLDLVDTDLLAAINRSTTDELYGARRELRKARRAVLRAQNQCALAAGRALIENAGELQ